MRAFKAGLMATCLLPMLTACATIVDSSTSKINVTTNPPANATCSAVNKRGDWNVATPGKMEVKKSKTDLNINCTDPRSGVGGTKVVESTVDPWVFGNVVLGGLIGLGVDWGTGATYQYPEDVVVQLQQSAQPAYQYAPAPVPGTTAPLPVWTAPATATTPATVIVPTTPDSTTVIVPPAPNAAPVPAPSYVAPAPVIVVPAAPPATQ